MSRLKLTVLSVAVLPCFALSAMAANIAGNPGFEIAGGGGATDSASWNEFTGGPAGTVSQRDLTMPDTGQAAHSLFAQGGPAAAGVAGITQNSIDDLGLFSLVPGTTLDASIRWKSSYGPGGVGNAALRILASDGTIVGNAPIGLPDTGGAYQTVNFPQLIVPPLGASPFDEYAAFIEIVAASGAFDTSFSGGFVDNVVIDGTTAIPEPSTVALVGLAGVALVTVRRRK